MSVKKTLPVVLFLGLFLAGCSDYDDDGFGGGSRGGLPYYLGLGYDVINSSYINRSDVKMSHPVLDQKRMIQDGLIVSEAIAGEQHFEMFVGTSIARFYSNRNAGIGMSAGSNNNVRNAMFSGRFGFEFNVSLDESRIDTNVYLRGRSYRYTQDEFVKNATADRLLDYLTEDFAIALQTRTAVQILDRYGSHVLIRYYKGGSLEFNYAYNGRALTTETQQRAALNASFLGISGGASSGSNQQAQELERNSIFRYYTRGGTPMDAFNLEDLRNNYGAWLNSIAKNADIAGIGNFDQSFISVWELAEAHGYPELAAAIEAEFNARAIRAGRALLVRRIRTERREFTSSSSYQLPVGVGNNSPAQVEVYALGAGGGGQGGHRKVYFIGSDDIGTGGAGGGGAAAYVMFSTEQRLSFSINVGAGGSGGSSTYVGIGPDWESGDGGGNGGNTRVSWNDGSLNAEGGVGGGGRGQVLTGGTGGRATTGIVTATSNGGNGITGDRYLDIRSEGGRAASINNRGSESSFGGGNGGLRSRGAGLWDGIPAARGGGGFGGYSDFLGSGGRGGDGHVIIVVRYFAEE